MWERNVSGALFALADTLDPAFSPRTHLERLAAYVVEYVEPDAEVGVFAVLPGPQAGGGRVIAGTTVLARRLEVIGVEAHDGPGFGCHHTGQPVGCADLRPVPRRWPVFSAAACTHGVVAVQSVPLRAHSSALGAVTLYRRQPGLISSARMRLAQEFADMAGVGLLQALLRTRTERYAAQLQTALTSRIEIEQAKGVLAERMHISADEAFTAIREQARRHNRRITNICRDIITSGRHDRWPGDEAG